MPTNPTDVTRSTILVVEPDILFRIAIAEYFRECCYGVLQAATADDAAALLGSKQNIDVIFAEL